MATILANTLQNIVGTDLVASKQNSNHTSQCQYSVKNIDLNTNSYIILQ